MTILPERHQKSMDEGGLIHRAIQGSEQAFCQIVGLHQGRIRAYLGRYIRDPQIVDDLAQEVFVTAYRSLSTYKGDSALSVWLIGIARHWALRYLRDEGRRRARSLAAALAAWKEEQIQSDAPIDDEVEALKACMQSLPEESARIITEHYYKGQSAVSIARALGKKESAVRMTLLRIRQALRKCVEGKLAAEGA